MCMPNPESEFSATPRPRHVSEQVTSYIDVNPLLLIHITLGSCVAMRYEIIYQTTDNTKNSKTKPRYVTALGTPTRIKKYV